MSERLYGMIKLILMSLLMITRMWVMMIMSLHLRAKETSLGRIEQEGM
jgi:hypothetical protein